MLPSVLDSHVHSWDDALDRPWLSDREGPPLTAPPLKYREAAAPSARAILVESGVMVSQRLSEALAASASGDSWPGLVGVVAAAPPDPNDASRYLDAIAAPLVRGIRVHPREAAAWPTVLGAELARRSLTLDVLSRWDEPTLGRLLSALPEEVPVVLNHALAPPIGEGWGSDAARDWLRALRDAARRGATVVKLSGLAALARPTEPWEASARPFALAALETFGSDRCMYGSDWPMSTLRVDAGPTHFLDFLFGLVTDPEARHDIAGGVAARIYAIAGP